MASTALRMTSKTEWSHVPLQRAYWLAGTVAFAICRVMVGRHEAFRDFCKWYVSAVAARPEVVEPLVQQSSLGNLLLRANGEVRRRSRNLSVRRPRVGRPTPGYRACGLLSELIHCGCVAGAGTTVGEWNNSQLSAHPLQKKK